MRQISCKPKMVLFMIMAALTASLMSAQASAASRIFNLHVKNIDSRPVSVKLTGDYTPLNNCYEGTPGIGQDFGNLAPGDQITIRIARVQGHGCNGEQGRFGLLFAPSDGPREREYFNFNNGGGMVISPFPNSYPGELSPKAQDESYTYTTWQRPVVKAGKLSGSWVNICQQVCDEEIRTEVTNSQTNETIDSQETVSAISVSLEAGMDFPGGANAKSTITGSQEQRASSSLRQEVSTGTSKSRTSKVAFSLEQMKENNIFTVWQWTATTRMSSGEQILIKSVVYTCTPNSVAPNYLPGSPQDLQACRGGGASQPAAQSATPAATQGTKRIFAVINGRRCGLEWEADVGGTETLETNEHVAKWDCAGNADPVQFIGGRIFASIQGQRCGLQWDANPGMPTELGPREHLAKWDCAGNADPVRIVGDHLYADIKGQSCGLEWATNVGGINTLNADEHLGKWDCDGNADAVTME